MPMRTLSLDSRPSTPSPREGLHAPAILGGYTHGVKNGQRPSTSHPRGARRVGLLALVAALALPGVALAQQTQSPADAAMAKLQATAAQALSAARTRRKIVLPAEKPAADKPGAATADKPAPEAPKGPPAEERAARGVVTIERGGQVVALGAVLAGDGRILSALSPLGMGNDLQARFADGSTARVVIGHHDRVWDLALLVPQTGKWPDGLAASSKDPVQKDATVHAFSAVKGKPAPTSIVLRAHRTLLGGDEKPLDDAIELGSHVSPSDLGAPIIDADGRVVGLLARGCAPNDGKPCTPVAFGAPMAAIRAFLRTVPASAVAPPAWLGIQGVADATGVARGVRIVSVHPQSPANEAKLRGGDRSVADVILAVDGTPVTSPEALADAIRAHGIGDKVPLLVVGQGRYRTVTVALRAAPEASPPPAAPAHPSELPPASSP